MNIPNILTLIRFLLVPVFGYLSFKGYYLMAVLVFIVAGITDVLDGYIARKYNMTTDFGKFADPLADKLMQVTALAFLTRVGLIPMVILIVIIAKDIFIGLGSLLLYKKKNYVASANWYGKLATVIFYFAVIMVIFIRLEGVSGKYTDILSNIFIFIAIISTFFAFFMYSLKYRKIRSD